jgi:hypothetical protein
MSLEAGPVPGMVADPAEVARFAAERDEDLRRERWLLQGQSVVLVAVLGVVALLVLLQRT